MGKTVLVAPRSVLVLIGLIYATGAAAQEQAEASRLLAMLDAAPVLPYDESAVAPSSPEPGWAFGMASWVAAAGDDLFYVLQRGENADAVLLVDREGRVVRSWGRGDYATPHSIRVDPSGNVWTTDAKSSVVTKFSPDGVTLLEISVGGQPTDCDTPFCGTSDVAFGPDGRVYIADGYRNARILEYTAEGHRVREWGSAGTGPGEFRLPHSIAVAEGVVYVADRENGRIQLFDLDGNFLEMWTDFGKTFALQVEGEAIWLATQQRKDPPGPGAAGWLMKVDRATGTLLGYVNVAGLHGLSVSEDGDLLFSPAPDNRPRWLTPRGNR